MMWTNQEIKSKDKLVNKCNTHFGPMLKKILVFCPNYIKKVTNFKVYKLLKLL